MSMRTDLCTARRWHGGDRSCRTSRTLVSRTKPSPARSRTGRVFISTTHPSVSNSMREMYQRYGRLISSVQVSAPQARKSLVLMAKKHGSTPWLGLPAASGTAGDARAGLLAKLIGRVWTRRRTLSPLEVDFGAKAWMPKTAAHFRLEGLTPVLYRIRVAGSY